jgi:hypothetical protein
VSCLCRINLALPSFATDLQRRPTHNPLSNQEEIQSFNLNRSNKMGVRSYLCRRSYYWSARRGVSEHIEENHKVLGLRLDEGDRAMTEAVLDRCRGRKMMDAIGYCGAEYRS